jgi:type I restriction enzyme M protein
MLRTEHCRLQLWTETGGTSYGKLTPEHILSLSIPVAPKKQIEIFKDRVSRWAIAIETSLTVWQDIGSENGRKIIRNSAVYGLESDDD